MFCERAHFLLFLPRRYFKPLRYVDIFSAIIDQLDVPGNVTWEVDLVKPFQNNVVDFHGIGGGERWSKNEIKLKFFIFIF